MQIIKTALLSYGMSGKLFHAPFITTHPGFKLAGAWERSKKLIQQDYAGVNSYATLDELLADTSIDLVIVNTPNDTHYEYAARVLKAGKHAVVEKAFTTTVEEAKALQALAEEKQLKLSVYQNRRYDSDFRTVQKVLEENLLGNIVEAEFRYDRFKPAVGPKVHKETPTPGAGVLMDLGPHLIDEALCLFGMPEAIFADVRITRPQSKVDDCFDVLLYYPTCRVRLKAGSFVKEAVPANAVHGTKGSFIKPKGDIQETHLLAGEKAGTPNWGQELESSYGVVNTENNGVSSRKTFPSSAGNYGDYYTALYTALTTGTPLPVTAAEATRTIQLLEAAKLSSQEKRVVQL